MISLVARKRIFGIFLCQTGYQYHTQSYIQSTNPHPILHPDCKTVVRRVYDMCIIQWSMDMLLHSKQTDFGRLLNHMEPSASLKKVVKRFYGNLVPFFSCYSSFFKLHQHRGVVLPGRLHENLNEHNVLAILEELLPPWGCIDIKTLAFIAGNSKPAELFQIILESDRMNCMYHISYDSKRNPHIYKKEDAIIARGDFKCNNTRVAYSLEVALAYVPHVPTFWVPSDACLSYMSYSNGIMVKTLGTKKLCGVLKGALVFSYRYERLCVKRNEDVIKLKLPKCEHDYEEFNLTPQRVLKIAFCLPVVSGSPETCAGMMFPSVLSWAEKSAYLLVDIVEMYPELMEVCSDGNFRSKIREKYPQWSPAKGMENTTEEEKKFDNSMSEDTPEIRTLLKMAANPTGAVFKTVSTYNPEYQGESYREGMNTCITLLGVREFLSYVQQNLSDHECLPWMNLKEKILSTHSLVKTERFRRTCQVRSVNTGVLVNWIKENPGCGMKFREQRVYGANYFDYAFYRNDSTKTNDIGNEFLDSKKVLEEVIYQIKYLSEQDGKGDVNITSICNALPSDARKATHNYGGFRRFLQQHNNIFYLSSSHTVRLRRKD